MVVLRVYVVAARLPFSFPYPIGKHWRVVGVETVVIDYVSIEETWRPLPRWAPIKFFGRGRNRFRWDMWASAF